MSDRELLEYAAKAAGIKFMWLGELEAPLEGYEWQGTWNPLTDDGDALRLAVKLGMVIDSRYTNPMTTKFNRVYYWPKGKERETWKGVDLDVDNDPYAATRRAIVRSAAEIGKGMK